MLDIIKKRILASNNLLEQDLNKIINRDYSCLLDPKGLYDIETFVDKLYEIKQHQQKNPKSLVIVDTDYDTDGVMSACVLTASLSLFNINHRIYIPSMVNGYGLSKVAIDEMEDLFINNGYTISTILTADNGTNANEAVEYAKKKGYTVLITDHHLGSDNYPIADALVNPNTPRDTYEFKGNAGATVIWKCMLRYAEKYDQSNYSLVMNLILFAGIANLSDVMPMVDENHFMTKEATRIINDLRQPLLVNGYLCFDYENYNNVLIAFSEFLQTIQDIRNTEKGKDSPYPDNEEFISWYISPMINSARRVEDTSATSYLALLHHDKNVRQQNIEKLYKLNLEKTKMTNTAISQINKKQLYPNSNVAVINCKHGILGLVSAKMTSENNKPSIMFVSNGDKLVSSARSNNTPLPLIIDYIQAMRPDIQISGGGHDNAAGYTINKLDYPDFKALFDQGVIVVNNTLEQKRKEQIASGELIELPHNVCLLTNKNLEDTLEYVNININSISKTDILNTVQFLNSLRPFGRDFNVVPTFKLMLPLGEIKNIDYNPNFWKTFKTIYNDIPILTFNQQLANRVKNSNDDSEIITCDIEFDINTFRGKTTPQIKLL